MRSPFNIVLCSLCGHRISTEEGSGEEHLKCLNCGEVFEQTPDYIDLLRSSESVIEETRHWDEVSIRGPKLRPDESISRIFSKSNGIVSPSIIATAKGRPFLTTVIAEVGCGGGQSAWHLNGVPADSVFYYGIDVSPEMLRRANSALPSGWNRTLIVADANRPVLASNSVDIVFTCGALHHLDIRRSLRWMSDCLKPDGLLVVYEPNFFNPLAALGRKFLKGFHTSGERALSPMTVKDTSNSLGLKLCYERGVACLAGPLSYAMSMTGNNITHSTKRHVGTLAAVADRFVESIPCVNLAISYYFLQIYKKSPDGQDRQLSAAWS